MTTPPSPPRHPQSSSYPQDTLFDDPLALGIKSLLDPHVGNTTAKLWEVHRGQIGLARELERLIGQLRAFLDGTEPPVLRPLVVKIASVGKRLAAVNNALQNIQTRVNRIYVTLSKQRTGQGA